jgi:hypothetical protein
MYGPDTKQAFGHIGLMNIFCWADPQREIAVSLLTTGKSLLGGHIFSIVRLLKSISAGCA